MSTSNLLTNYHSKKLSKKSQISIKPLSVRWKGLLLFFAPSANTPFTYYHQDSALTSSKEVREPKCNLMSMAVT
jgi:hypothetical protein